MGFREFKAGERLTDRSSSDWNELIRMTKQASADAQYAKSHVGGIVKVPQPDRMVIVTQTSPHMMVQEVRQSDLPPTPCTTSSCSLRRYGDSFKAYPDLGKTLDDFSDAIVTGSGDLGPTDEYFNATFISGTWTVQQRGGGGGGTDTHLAMMAYPSTTDQAINDAYFADTDSETAMIYPVVARAGGSGVVIDIEMETPPANEDGSQPADAPVLREIFCWPGLQRKDYLPMLKAIQIPILRAEKHDGLWFLRQMPPLYLVPPDPLRRRPAGGCTPR